MIVPLLHTVLIKPDDVETKTASGIVIPDLVTEKERKAVETGTVISIGCRAFIDYGADPTLLSIGDRVAYARYSGKSVKDSSNVEYLLVNDIDCLCKIQ